MRHSCRVEFHYRLTGLGWSEAYITHGGETARVTASYLSDALGNLLSAVLDVLKGADSARCSWDEEPGEYRWIFVRRGEFVDLQVLKFGENRGIRGERSDAEGVPVFQALAPADEVAAAFAVGAREVLNEHGEEGYLDRWREHAFPVQTLS